MRGWKSTMESKHYLNEDGKWKSERNLALQHRALMHDYSAKGTYMITLCANARKPIFGDLICHADGTAQITPTTVGKIVEAEWNAIRNHIPQIEILDYQLMPDHIHGLIKAKETLPISLGQIIRRYKMRCTSLYRALIHDEWDKPKPQGVYASLNIEQRHEVETHSLWEKNYNDRIAYSKQRYEILAKYIHDNPRRLALKRSNPGYFTIMRDINIACSMKRLSFTAMGNIHLLDNPQKNVVQCSRKLTELGNEREYRAFMHDAIAKAKEGEVTISAGISKGEQQICKAIREDDLPLIILLKDGFPSIDDPGSKYYKPGGIYFEACAKGRLLLMEPTKETFLLDDIAVAVHKKSPASPNDSMRYRFLALNEMARMIAECEEIVH